MSLACARKTRSSSLQKGEGRFQKAYPSLEDVVGSIPAIDIPMEEWDDIIQDEVAQRYDEENQ